MVLILTNGYRFISALENLIDEFDDYNVISLSQIDEIDLKDYSSIILAFSDIVVSDQKTDIYIENLDKIKTVDIPVLGIGVGHHLLGILYGASPAYQPYRDGFEEISIIKDDPLFDKLPEDFSVSFNHTSTVAIPVNFELLASSDKSINEVMRHSEKPVYGIQFQPELSGNLGRIIIENFLNVK